MSKILIVGDIHFRSKKLSDISSAWTRLMDYAYGNNVSLILQAGDVFDHPNVHGRNVDMGTIYHEFLAPMMERRAKPIDTVIIPGNHDMGGPKDLDALAPLDGYSWIRIIRRPIVEHMADGLSVCAIPWVNRTHVAARLRDKNCPQDKIGETISQALTGIIPKLATDIQAAKKNGDVVVMIGHVEVTGAQLGHGHVQGDGLFEFSPSRLAILEADAYGLAHIHVRQPIPGLSRPNDGYLGSICQLSFGEAGNPTGCRLLTIEGDKHAGHKITGDVFLDNDISPRYYAVDTMKDLQYRRGTDYVLLRGDIRPEDLPDGVVFERRPPRADARQRAESLTADSPIQTLLQAWHQSSKCKVDMAALLTVAQHLMGQAAMPPESIGSLDSIEQIVLKNITCHENTTINFGGIMGLWGLEGDNGSGKTTAIEAILVALYGMSPSRPYLPSLLSRGSQEDAMVETIFGSSGKTYLARREFKPGKAFGHKAFLFERTPDKELLAKAGPKVADVTKTCMSLVGDPDLVKAGIFASQTDDGNIIELEPSERKELFAKLLGTDTFLVIGEVAKKQAANGNAEMDLLLSKMERLRIEVADEPAVIESLASLKKKVEAGKASLQARQAELEGAKRAISEADMAKRERAEAQAKLSVLNSKKEAIRKQGQEAKARREELTKTSPAPIEGILADAKSKKEELDKVMVTKAENEAKAQAMRGQALALRNQAAALFAETRTKYAQACAEFAKKEATFRQKRQDELRSLLDKRAMEMTRLQVAMGKATSAGNASAMLEGFPNLDVCKSCPLAKDGIMAKASLPSLMSEIEDAKASLASIEAAMSKHEADTSSRIEAARKSVPVEDSFMPQERATADDLVSQAALLEADASKMAPSREDLQIEASLREAAGMIPSLEVKLSAARASVVDMARLDATLTSLKAQFLSIEAEMKSVVVPELADDSAVRALASNLSAEIAQAMAGMELSHVEVGKHEAKAEAYAAKNAEIAKIASRCKDVSKETDVLNALAAAFGRDGIPQLIVDSTIPRFQDIMADLMSDFDGRWAIQVSSQKTTKAGSINEVIDILVDDGCGERDISTYSGGEKQLLRSIIRVAFSTLQAERSGKGLRILVLDEPTHQMDDDNKGNFMRMIGRLSKSFRQVFVVSHDDGILSSLPNCVSFSRTVGQPTSVSVRTA